MRIARRWPCPHCGKTYYIQKNSRDELDIVECCQIAGFALRHCPRCGWVQRIEPREDEEVKAIRERYGRANHGGSESQERTPRE